MSFLNIQNNGYPEDGLSNPYRRWAVLSSMLALFMSVLDVNIVNVVLPELARKFQITDSTVIWVVNIYQLAIVTSLLSFSFLGDIFGYNKVFLMGVALFVISSLFCALSNSFESLLIARFFQGIGGSAITSVNQAQLRVLYPKKLIGKGLGLNAMVVAVSSASGPSIAGAILTFASWQWLFAINIPIGLVALFMGIKFLPRLKKRRPQKFDWKASVLNALFFGFFIYFFEHIAHQGSRIYLVFIVAILLISGYVYIKKELQKEVPMLPIDLMKIPIFRLSIFTSICSFIANMLALIALPFMLQNMLGYNEIQTGLLLTPWPVATIVVAPIAGSLVSRIHPGLLGGAGMLIFFTGLIGLGFLPTSPTVWDLVWRLLLCGAGFGLFQTPNNTTLMSSGPKSRSGGASGMLGMARLTGQTIGATSVALIFNYVESTIQIGVCFKLAAIFAIIAGIFSMSRLSSPSPVGR